MDDRMLRDEVYPLLRRSINFYRHMLYAGQDGRLHLPKTYCPETGEVPDCNYDLALLRWGTETLIRSAERLKIDDPLLPEWKKITSKLVDYPVDENGFMRGRGAPWNRSHRHYSHLLMIYPLYLVNVEQGPAARALIKKSTKHWIDLEGRLMGYSYTGASSLSAVLGNGNEALRYLKGLESYLQPNGLYKEAGPVMETPLSAAQSIHDMLIQSWGDKIRVFPAMPDAWPDAQFYHLRTEGAFLISAARRDGKTLFVQVESLAGEPCRIRPGIKGKVRVTGSRSFQLKQVSPGVYDLDLRKGEYAILSAGTDISGITIKPVPADKDKCNSFGL